MLRVQTRHASFYSTSSDEYYVVMNQTFRMRTSALRRTHDEYSRRADLPPHRKQKISACRIIERKRLRSARRHEQADLAVLRTIQRKPMGVLIYCHERFRFLRSSESFQKSYLYDRCEKKHLCTMSDPSSVHIFSRVNRFSSITFTQAFNPVITLG